MQNKYLSCPCHSWLNYVCKQRVSKAGQAGEVSLCSRRHEALVPTELTAKRGRLGFPRPFTSSMTSASSSLKDTLNQPLSPRTIPDLPHSKIKGTTYFMSHPYEISRTGKSRRQRSMWLRAEERGSFRVQGGFLR